MTEERVRLEDGSVVVIRPVEPSDAPVLAAAFEHLSDASRQSRFLTGMSRLSDRELRALTAIDHSDHEAFGAVDPRDGRGLGIARYMRYSADPTTAEFAITVIDEWQKRGLAGHLMRRLVRRALQEGVRTFTALVASGNHAVLPLLRSCGGVVTVVEQDRYNVEYKIALRDRPAGDDARHIVGLPSADSVVRSPRSPWRPNLSTGRNSG